MTTTQPDGAPVSGEPCPLDCEMDGHWPCTNLNPQADPLPNPEDAKFTSIHNDVGLDVSPTPQPARPTRLLERGARRLVEAVWQAVDRGEINARSMIGDAALDLRDEIDPQWMPARQLDVSGERVADAIAYLREVHRGTVRAERVEVLVAEIERLRAELAQRAPQSRVRMDGEPA